MRKEKDEEKKRKEISPCRNTSIQIHNSPFKI